MFNSSTYVHWLIWNISSSKFVIIFPQENSQHSIDFLNFFRILRFGYGDSLCIHFYFTLVSPSLQSSATFTSTDRFMIGGGPTPHHIYISILEVDHLNSGNPYRKSLFRYYQPRLNSSWHILPVLIYCFI